MWDVSRSIGDPEECQCPKCGGYEIACISNREIALITECNRYKEALNKILSVAPTNSWIKLTLKNSFPDVFKKIMEK